MKTTPDYFRWLWSYLRDYIGWLVLAFISMLLFSLTNGAVLMFMREGMRHMREAYEGSTVQSFSIQVPTVDWLGFKGGEWVMMRGTPAEILTMVTILGGIILAMLIIAEFSKLSIMDVLGMSVSRDIRDGLYQHIINRPLAFFEQRNVGDLISRLSSDVNKVSGSISGALKDIIQSPLEIIIIGGIAVYMAPYLSVLFLLVVPVCGYVIFAVGKRIKKYSRGTQDVFGDLLSQIQERFAGIKLVKAVVTEEREISDFKRQNQSHFRKSRRKKIAKAGLRTFLHLMVYGAALVLMFVGGKFILAGYMHPEDFIVFLTCLIWMYKPIRKLGGVNDSIQNSRGAAERIDAVFQVSREALIKLPEGTRAPEFTEGIEFDDVCFRYEGADEDAIHDLSFSLQPGDRLGIVGESGAGKSTLVDLLLRFYDPVGGEVTLDGDPLSEYQLEPYRKLFGLVTQHTILFDETVLENIRYGREDLSRERVEQATKQAQAWPFIDQMAEGLDTKIGEQGVRLSGGERQRIALARALASRPEILVLDEATSNIDSRSENLILESIEQLPGEMTIISISHALASVQFANQILVLNDHTLEASGTHDDLIGTSPTYEKLYQLQVDDFEEAFS